MNSNLKSNNISSNQGDVFYAPWEKGFSRVLSPFEEFLHRQTTSGILLICVAILALIFANSGLSGFYNDLKHTYISIGIDGWTLKKTLHHWVNDGLMTFFFFLVGLELKREILVGELSSLRKATLPIAAAIGGMVIPAVIYFSINPSGVAAGGWGIPMATDIAFALGILALLSSRIPKSLVIFLVALAIVDDLGAVIVIAIFYTETIELNALAIAGGLFALLMAFNLGGIRKVVPYFIVAVFLWYAFLLSGVHATLAGVLGAFAVPATPKYDPLRFRHHVTKLMECFGKSHKEDKSIMNNDELRTIVLSLEDGAKSVQTMLQRLEHIWHIPIAYIIIPIFVFLNAGIPLEFLTLSDTLLHPVAVGISSGLIIGKFIGITGVSWIFLKLGLATLPHDVRFTQIAGVSLLAGIGFTMSIFIAELGFANNEELLLISKTGVMFSSLVAGISGFVWLFITGRKKTDSDHHY